MPTQGGATAILAGLDPPDTDGTAYIEHLHHPALLSPVTSSGRMWIRPDGTLVREQLAPEPEIAEIGERLIRLRKGAEDEPNLLPIPAEMDGLIDTLRLLLERATPASGMPEVARIARPGAGWRVQVNSPAPTSSLIVLEGCAGIVTSLSVEQADRTLRIIRFGAR